MPEVIKPLEFRYAELRELKLFKGKLILVYAECIWSNKNSLVGRSAWGRGSHFDEKTMMKHDHVAQIPLQTDWQIVEHFFGKIPFFRIQLLNLTDRTLQCLKLGLREVYLLVPLDVFSGLFLTLAPPRSPRSVT